MNHWTLEWGSRTLSGFTDEVRTETHPTHYAFVSLFYSFHKRGMEVCLCRIRRSHTHKHTHCIEDDAVPHLVLTPQSLKYNRTSRIAHSWMWCSWNSEYLHRLKPVIADQKLTLFIGVCTCLFCVVCCIVRSSNRPIYMSDETDFRLQLYLLVESTSLILSVTL